MCDSFSFLGEISLMRSPVACSRRTCRHGRHLLDQEVDDRVRVIFGFVCVVEW